MNPERGTTTEDTAMWTIQYEGTTTADPAAVHAVLADVAHWHEWNAGVQRAELHGPFEAGSTALMVLPDGEELPFHLAAVTPDGGFVDETPIPDAGVVVRIHHLVEPLAGGGARIAYRCEVDGPAADELGPEIGPAVSGDFPDVIAALARRAEQADR
jgi:Polyketide cyclase / dehydrase and lipid transport